jgi:hypothetical protein
MCAIKGLRCCSDFVRCVPKAGAGVGFDCLFLFKLGRDYVIHMLTICVLLFGLEYACLDICS